MVGILLFGSGYGTALLEDARPLAGPEHTAIDAWSDTFDYSGSTKIEATHSILRASGEWSGTIQGDVSVLVWECQSLKWHLSGLPITWEGGHGGCQPEGPTVYANATIGLQGHTTARLFSWPHDGGDEAPRFTVRLSEANNATVRPSPYADNVEASYDSYRLEAPVLAVASGAPHLGNFIPTNLSIDEVLTAGDVQVVVDNGAVVTVEHNGTTRTISTWYEEEKLGTAPAEAYPGTSERYAIITTMRANLTAHVTNADTLFISRTTDWAINGTVTIPAKRGNLSDGDEARPLDDDILKIDGPQELSLKTEGLGTLQERIGFITTPGFTSLSEPEFRARTSGEPGSVSLNGQSLVSAQGATAPGPLVPEQLTLTAQLLGLLFLLWGAARASAFLGLTAVGRAPLAHPRRKKIHDFVRSAGIAHLSRIQRATSIPAGSLAHHLGILCRSGHVIEVRQSGYTVYLVPPMQLAKEDLERVAVLANQTRHEICAALFTAGDLAQNEISARIGISQSATSRQLAILQENGLVERIGARHGTYRVTEVVQRWFAGTSTSGTD